MYLDSRTSSKLLPMSQTFSSMLTLNEKKRQIQNSNLTITISFHVF